MTRTTGTTIPIHVPGEVRTRTSTRHLSGVVERMLIRHERESASLADPTLLPLPEAGFRPVITTPKRPGTPINIRVNDPAEDMVFGNKTNQSDPSLAVNGHTVVIGFNDSTPIGSFAGMANSIAMGQVFSDEGALTPADESGNPVLATDTRGNFFYALLVANFNTRESYIGVSKSTDGGWTFPSPVDVSGTSGGPQTSFRDKPWITVDKTDGVGQGNLYVCWTEFSDFDWSTGSAGDSQIMFARSTDGGSTWSRPESITQSRPVLGPQGAVSVVDPEGRLFVAWLARDLASIEIRQSEDQGLSFINPVAEGRAVTELEVLPEMLNGNVRADSLVSLATDPGNGNLYLAYAASPGKSTADVYCIRSTDHGATWSHPLKVNDDATETDQWMPSVAVTSDGIVGVMFFDRRNDPRDNINIDVVLALSSNQGASFLPNQRITTSSFPPPLLADPDIKVQYLGDYNHMVAVGTRFYMAWGDNRDFVGMRNDPNIYFASVGTQDCFVRDNPTDDGSVPHTGLAYVSPDITPSLNPAQPGTPNPVLVTVHNLGPMAARNVQVRLCWSEPATQTPTRLWRTDHITVNGIATAQQTIEEIPPSSFVTTPQPFILNPPFPGWAAGQGHFTLMAQVDSAGDPITFPKGSWDAVKRDNNLAIRNIHMVALDPQEPANLRFLVAGDTDRLWLADLILDARALPAGIKMELTLPEKILWYAKFEGVKIVRRHHETAIGQGRWDPSEDRRQSSRHRESRMVEEFESLNVTLEFEPGRVGRIIDLELRPMSQHLAELTIQPPPTNPNPQQVALEIQQVVNHQIVGGLLYLIRPA